MTSTAIKLNRTIEDLTLSITQEIHVRASLQVTFDSLLEYLGPLNERPDGTPISLKIEPWPGGRWYRDLGDENGHLWGHVQAIKRPTLLEFYGPLFMSYPVELERAVPAERGGWRNADQVSSPGVRTDFRRASRGSCEGLDVHERWRAQTRRSEAPAAVSAAAVGGKMYVPSVHSERRVDYHGDHVHRRVDGARSEEVAREE